MPKLYSIFFFILFWGCKKDDKVTISPPPPPYVPIKLEYSSFALGNSAKQIEDSFFLQFNKSIDVIYIRLLSSICLPRLEHKLSGNGKNVTFYKLLCGQLSRDFQFEFTVRDKEGKTLTDSVVFKYYDRKFSFEGEVMNYMITPDNKYYWVSTRNPDRIYQLGLQDTSYKKIYNVNFTPAKIVLNPINQNLYILNSPVYASNTDKIYVMDPEDGRIIKTITIEKDRYDDPLQTIASYDIEFGYNGYGVLLTSATGYGNKRWRILDSRFNDSIYVHPSWIDAYNSGNTSSHQFSSCHVNHDKTKFYFKPYYSEPKATVLNCNTLAISEIVYASSNPSHYIVPNKTADQFFIASFAFQTIIGKGSTGAYSQFDNRYSESADFSYRPNEPNIVYYDNNQEQFLILDYTNARVLFGTRIFNMNKMKCTTDGKYMLALTSNVMVIYNTEMFYKYI